MNDLDKLVQIEDGVYYLSKLNTLLDGSASVEEMLATENIPQLNIAQLDRKEENTAGDSHPAVESAVTQGKQENTKANSGNLQGVNQRVDRSVRTPVAEARSSRKEMDETRAQIDPAVFASIRDESESVTSHSPAPMDAVENSAKNVPLNDREIRRKIDAIDSRMGTMDDMEASIESMRRTIDEKLNVDFDEMYEGVLDQMNVESVKEYRNIQAVIVEENAKQNRMLLGIDDNTKKLRNRLNHVMIAAIVSFVVSILVLFISVIPNL